MQIGALVVLSASQPMWLSMISLTGASPARPVARGRLEQHAGEEQREERERVVWCAGHRAVLRLARAVWRWAREVRACILALVLVFVLVGVQPVTSIVVFCLSTAPFCATNSLGITRLAGLVVWVVIVRRTVFPRTFCETLRLTVAVVVSEQRFPLRPARSTGPPAGTAQTC